MENKNIIVKIPFNLGALKKRCKGIVYAPDDIVKQFEEIYLSFDMKEKEFKVREIKITNENISEDLKTIYDFAKTINSKAFYIGGDHTISYSLIKAFKEMHEDSKILIFDAHPDTESDFFISHEDYLRNLIPNYVKANDVMLVGIRNMSKEEKEFLDANNIAYITALDVLDKTKKSLQMIKSFVDRDCYVSIDIDAIDPAFAPGTGYCEPFGLLPFQLLSALKQIKERIKGVDLVEVNTEKDLNEMTSKLAARIIYELM